MDAQISHIAGISNVKRCAPLANEFVKSFASKNNWGAARAKVICASIARLYSRQMYAHTHTHTQTHTHTCTITYGHALSINFLTTFATEKVKNWKNQINRQQGKQQQQQQQVCRLQFTAF